MSDFTPTKVLSQSIVKTLLYFDLFNYPLNQEEVYLHLQTDHVTKEEVSDELQRLRNARVLFQIGDFFSMQDSDEVIQRRLAGNKKAQEYNRIALRRGRLIFQFPFVRAVMISGSLSKNYADDSTDIDFFIITAPGRLWVARTLLVLFKRVFLLNSHKYFCVNYFVDEQHLEIEEKNLFTATELSTLVPLHGSTLYDELMERNAWVKELLPHVQRKFPQRHAGDQNGWVKNLQEWFLDARTGDWLEKTFMRLTQRRWEKLYSSALPKDDFAIAFKSNGHASKNHPENYQRKVMDRYRKRLEEYALPFTWNQPHE